MSSDLSVCMLNRNEPELLRLCVASCISEIERAGITGEVIIIDNASTDGSPQGVAHLFPTVRIIRNEENLGFSAANNKAIRVSRGRFVLLLNDDAVLQQGSLELMLQKLESNPKIGALGPKLLNPDGSVQMGFTNKRFPRVRSAFFDLLLFNQFLYKNSLTRALFTEWRGADPSGETDQVAAACLLARREALDAVGHFDEGFYYLYEDTDLCYRLKKAGWLVFYLAEARVIHYGSSSLKKWSRSERNTTLFRSSTYYFKKHASHGKRLLVRLTGALALLLRLPIIVLFMLFRSSSTRIRWSGAVTACLRALRVLLLEWH